MTCHGEPGGKRVIPQEEQGGGAIAFTGSWRDYAPIAFTNLLLTVVTLGIYSFWARTRERQYLWSHTRFIDDHLEYSGTGLELFVGYVIAFFTIILPLGAIALVQQGVLLRGHAGWAILILLFGYTAVYYLTGVAKFRALRYRLSRTYWHGIRGGSDVQGLAYGWEYLWRNLAGTLAAGLMVPWAMTSLWNRRWGKMSFGPYAFHAGARWEKIIGRYLAYYLMPIVFIFAIVAIGIVGGVGAAAAGASQKQSPDTMLAIVITLFIVGYILFFVVLGLVALFYYSAFYREAVGQLELGGLQFDFTARTWDWIKLWAINIALVVGTLGVGYIFVNYRTYTFAIRHLRAYGEVRLDQMTQSSTRDPGQGEGLLDAFDVGAF